MHAITATATLRLPELGTNPANQAMISLGGESEPFRFLPATLAPAMLAFLSRAVFHSAFEPFENRPHLRTRESALPEN